jgi:molybdopterin synthase sulfur carrier subunit
MKVNFFATLRRIAGQKTVEFDLGERGTAQDLLNTVLTVYPDMRDELLDENGDLYRHVHLFINGRDVYFLPDNMDTVLKDTDKIDMFPAVAGGAAQRTHEQVVRNLPLWLMREYLEEVGGTVQTDGRIKGDGWTATLEQIEDFKLGSIVVGQVRFQAKGDEQAVNDMWLVLKDKMIRAGG